LGPSEGLFELPPSAFEPIIGDIVEGLLEALQDESEPPRTRTTEDCCAVPVVRQEAERIRDLIEDVLDVLSSDSQEPSISQSGTLARPECDENGQPFVASVAFESLPEAFDLLSIELAQVRYSLGLCDRPPAQSDPSIVASGTATLGNTVEYVGISDDVREVELVITGEIPKSVRTFRGWGDDEQQSKFGFISAAYSMISGGFGRAEPEILVWTRRTVLQLGEPYRAGRRVRVFLKPGLSWILRDTGLRT
jgi:hypothetical protein